MQMSKLFYYFLLAFQASSLSGASTILHRNTPHVLHEKRAVHSSWQATRRVDPHVMLPLRVALKQPNLHTLSEHLLSVSEPSSLSYGKHWTPEQVLQTFSPPAEAADTVINWLKGAGIEEKRVTISKNKGWVEVKNANIGEVEGILGAEYWVFQDEIKGEEQIACHSYHLPVDLVDHVDFVLPTVQPNIRLEMVAPDLVHSHIDKSHYQLQRRDNIIQAPVPANANISLANCDSTRVTPDCLKALYNVTYTPKATDRNTFGIVSYFPTTFLQSDLDMFFRNFSPPSAGRSPILVPIDGGSISPDATSTFGEDGGILQVSMSLVEPQPVKLLQVGNAQTGRIASFNEWLDAVDGTYCTSQGGDNFAFDPQLPNPLPGGFPSHSCGTVSVPNVVSNSQALREGSLSAFYLERQCAEFGKLGLMGVTVLYGAGNTGTTEGYCMDEHGAINLNATNFVPAWPSACPWVTSVGGTQVKANISSISRSAGDVLEEVWNIDRTLGFFQSSGGGFSNQFLMPSYQKAAVNSYVKNLKKTDPHLLGSFNSKGRAYPDLSANANMAVLVSNGTLGVGSGTSIATPTVAALITLVNDARIANGKKPVGFINPVLYSPEFAEAFNDITEGVNTGCKGLQGERDGGFKATKGWDPASGMGTPNLGKLIEKWLALP